MSYESRKDHPRLGDFYFGEIEMRRLAVSPKRVWQTFGSLTWTGLWVKTPDLSRMQFAGMTSPAPQQVSAPSTGAVPVPESPTQVADALLHSFLVATFLGRDAYAQPNGVLGWSVQIMESVLGPLFLGLMALAVRRQFQR